MQPRTRRTSFWADDLKEKNRRGHRTAANGSADRLPGSHGQVWLRHLHHGLTLSRVAAIDLAAG